jgi:hypothetical protein
MAICARCGIDKAPEEYPHYNCKSTRENPGVCKHCIKRIDSNKRYLSMSDEEKKTRCRIAKQWRIDNPERAKELDRNKHIRDKNDPEKWAHKLEQARSYHRKAMLDPEYRERQRIISYKWYHGMSPEKKKEYDEKYRIIANDKYKNPIIREKILERSKKYAKEARLDEVRGEAIRERIRKYNKEHPEKLREEKAKYAKRHPDILIAKSRRQREKLGRGYIIDCFRSMGIKDSALVSEDMIELQRTKILLMREIEKKERRAQ